MKKRGRPDCFEAINGPEDGALFPVARLPFYIGSDPCCGLSLRLDKDVWAQHAHVSAAGGGYRIRSCHGAPVHVDGRRAGRLFSQIVKPGSVIQIANTCLRLECTPEGMAHHAANAVLDSDPIWILRQCARFFGRLGWFSGRLGFRLIGRVLSGWLALAAAGLLLYFCWPKVYPYIYGTVTRLIQSILSTFMRQ